MVARPSKVTMNLRLKRLVLQLAHRAGYDVTRYPPSDFTRSEIEIARSVKPYTMTSIECIYTLIHGVKYIVQNNIPGDIVECGVWRGGSVMAIGKTLLSLNHSNRHLYLYDTFEGMPRPSTDDVSYEGTEAVRIFEKERISDLSSNWLCATLDEVKNAVYSIGYDKERIHLIKGKVEDTIPHNAPESISILRLDTDWYESTRHELVHLFPRLSVGGVLILDDYGHWLGARKAVDEFISENNICILLNRIDRAARIGVKLPQDG